MSQKLSDWASIGEIVSSLAVVATLIFLIIGVQENTEVIRASAFDRNLDSLIQLRTELAQDDYMSALFRQYWDGRVGELNDEDRFRLRLWLSALWAVYEKAYYANEYGTMGPSEYERFATQICASRARVKHEPFWAELESFFSRVFADHVNSRCE